MGLATSGDVGIHLPQGDGRGGKAMKRGWQAGDGLGSLRRPTRRRVRWVPIQATKIALEVKKQLLDASLVDVTQVR